jgi:signal transduction histidine kinase
MSIVDGATEDTVNDAQILIVDDERANLEALEVTLASTGCRLVRAQSAEEALLALLDQDFACIVLDIRMPGIGGLELAEIIKRRRRTQHVPILFLTAHLFDERDVVLGYRTGAVDYLTKPVNPDILRSKIAVFVELFRKTQALARTNEALQREVQARELAQDELRRVNQDLEQRVAERTAALQEADRRKDEFLATLSHELRTPLNAIYGWARMLRSGLLDQSAVPRAVEVIERNAQIQTQLIGDLLDVSRIVTGKLHLTSAPTSMALVIEEAAESVRMLAQSRGIEVAATIQSQATISGDADRLQQVTWNLLSNAIKFTTSGGRVDVLLEQQGREVVMTVSDTGCGIRRELLPYVFERFRQADNSTTRVHSGLGIGLTIVKHLVEAHGGAVSADSAGEGKGAVFTVRLPIDGAADAAVPADAPGAVGAGLDGRLRGISVLVVEDEEDSREMICAALASHEATPLAVSSAVEGLATLASGTRVDAIVADIAMPGMDGYAFIGRVRGGESPARTALVAVAVTAHARDEDRVRALEAGYDAHLAKPIDPARLAATLDGLLAAGTAGAVR